MTNQATGGELSRRSLLYGAAAAAGAVMLGACSGGGGGTGSDNEPGGSKNGKRGSATDPLKKPSKFSESPELAKLVKAGKLPPVEKRLPENPYVIPHYWVERGKYGGTIRMITKKSNDTANLEYFYGHSPLRWLNDGLTIGPGLVEKFEPNDDASEWTFTFRKGLKWSDGHPWTTKDVMFWWNDLIINEDFPEVYPDECKSGNDTPAKMVAVDDYTLKLTFDAPAPLTADRMANWVNGPAWEDTSWADWMAPSHFAEKYHPKYNKSLGADWVTNFYQKVNFGKNPECPTMTGWMLESYKEGQSLKWVRNPYYWAVTKEGDQLPYVDGLEQKVFEEFKIGKNAVYQGNVDFMMGQFYSTGPADVEDIDRNAKKAQIERVLWDTGSGTGSMLLFNLDHRDSKLRKLFRNKEFRRAVSHAFNRKAVQSSLYFDYGEQTTGTLSPKAIEYLVNAEGKNIYKQWRDSFKKYDKAKANAMLDKLGLKKGGDGFRTHPDGSKLTILFDYAQDTDEEHIKKGNLLKRDLEAVGLRIAMNPVPPDTFQKRWENGEMTAKIDWEVGDGPNHLVFPQWLVPIEPQRWAPLQGRWYTLLGDKKLKTELSADPHQRKPPRMAPDKGGPIEAIWTLYNKSKVEPDKMKRTKLVWDMIKIHVDEGPFFMGSVANPPRVIVKKTALRNVPRREDLKLSGFANPWIHPTPAVYDVETFFWENPDEHK